MTIKPSIASLSAIIFILCFTYPRLFAQYTIEYSDVYFNKYEGEITGYKSDSTDIIIPSKFTIDQSEYNVLSIGFRAFYRKNLKSVVISEGINSIDQSAFFINSISNLSIPSTVNHIGPSAFNSNKIKWVNGTESNGIIYARTENGSDDMSRIVSYGGTSYIIDFIPSSVKTIDEMAFRVDSLISVEIPNSVDSIGEGSFQVNSLTELVIPEGVIHLGDRSFAHNEISSLEIPLSLRTLGWGAFNSNAISQVNNEASDGIFYALHSDGNENQAVIASYGGTADLVDFIPEGVTSIGKQAFSSSGLTEILLPQSLKDIHSAAFAYNDLTSITFPKSVSRIQQYAFRNNHLSEIIFEDSSSLEMIYSSVFDYNNEFTGYVLPTSVVDGFSGYKDILGDMLNPGDTVFNRNMPIISIFPLTLSSDWVVFEDGEILHCNAFQPEIFIPPFFNINGKDEAVISIGKSAFSFNLIENISLPQGLELIKENAFSNNYLDSVDIPNTVYLIEANAFLNNPLTSILLPSSVVREGNTFVEWQNNYAEVVTEITNFHSSYFAVFDPVLTQKNVSIDNHSPKIYPNPTETFCYLQHKNPISRVIITDISGKTVDTIFGESRKLLRIITEDYSPGIYFIKVYDDKKISSLKFLKL